MKLRLLRSAPELHVALFAFLLNLPWEFLQVPLYAGMPKSNSPWRTTDLCIVFGRGLSPLLAPTLAIRLAHWVPLSWGATDR